MRNSETIPRYKVTSNVVIRKTDQQVCLWARFHSHIRCLLLSYYLLECSAYVRTVLKQW